MIITSIERRPGKKNLVHIDGEYAFMLYDRELSVYGLEQGREISEHLYDTIIQDTVLRRAKIKAMAILERADRSETELRRKLKEAFYSPSIIDSAVEYVRSFHYVDDTRLVDNYIRTHSAAASRREITNKLLLKGISKEEIERGFDETEADRKEDCGDEIDAAIRTLRKKLNGQTSLDYKSYTKVMAFMFRKGFGRSTVSAAMDAVGVTCSDSSDSDIYGI